MHLFIDVALKLKESMPNLQILLGLHSEIQLIEQIDSEIIVIQDHALKALELADAAIVASGTATLQAAIMNTLFTTPPALSADIYNTGLYLTGGGSMLRGLDKRISQKTKLPVYVAEDPLRAVARGTVIALKNTAGYSFLIQ